MRWLTAAGLYPGKGSFAVPPPHLGLLSWSPGWQWCSCKRVIGILVFSCSVAMRAFKLLFFGNLIKHVSKEKIFVQFLRKSFLLQLCQKSMSVYPSISVFQSFHCLVWWSWESFHSQNPLFRGKLMQEPGCETAGPCAPSLLLRTHLPYRLCI